MRHRAQPNGGVDMRNKILSNFNSLHSPLVHVQPTVVLWRRRSHCLAPEKNRFTGFRDSFESQGVQTIFSISLVHRVWSGCVRLSSRLCQARSLCRVREHVFHARSCFSARQSSAMQLWYFVPRSGSNAVVPVTVITNLGTNLPVCVERNAS